MLKKLFKKTEKVTKEDVFSPVDGKVVDLSVTPDPTFADKLLGDGVAIEPSDGEFVAPVNGKVVNLFPTKHAIGIESEAGVEYLIHIGLDTVTLDGKGFSAHVKQGDQVKIGDPLVTVDLEYVANHANIITPFVITSEIDAINKIADQEVKKGETKVMTVHL